MATKKKVDEKKDPTFTKSQLAGAKRYTRDQDILSVVLEDGKTYTFDQVDELINNFMKDEVK